MKSFVILSYYQLEHAIAMTLELGEQTNLYFVVNHVEATYDLIARIRETGLFHDVIMIDHSLVHKALSKELKKTAGMSPEEIDAIGVNLFEKYLTPFYEKIFSGADPEDDLYLYNDFQPHYYYIARHFKRIIGVEDGYAVLEKQMNLINNTGIESFNNGRYKSAFVGKYWPLMQWKNPNVKKVLSSIPLTEEAPAYLKEKVCVLDYKDLRARHKEKLDDALGIIFKTDFSNIHSDSSLILTQSLSRNNYCNALEDYLFHRKMIREELDHSEFVYVKPHPADKTDYSVLKNDRVIIMDKRFPVEMMEDEHISFNRIVSFMSSATNCLRAEEIVKFNEDINVDRDSIVNTIKDYIKDEEVRLDFFVRIRECTPENYVNLYSMLKKRKRVDVRVHALLCGADEEYFDHSHASVRIEEYFHWIQAEQRLPLWAEEIRKIPKISEETVSRLSFITTKELNDETVAQIISDTSEEFFFLSDIKNIGVEVAKDVLNVLVNYSEKTVKVFPIHTYIDGVRCNLGLCTSGECVSNSLAGRIIHKAFLDDLLAAGESFDRFRVLSLETHRIQTFSSNNYYIDPHDCNLLNAETQEIIHLISESTSADEAACLIKALQSLLTAEQVPAEMLSELLLQEDGEYLKEGLIRALVSDMSFRSQQEKRFIHLKEKEFRYAKKEIDQLIFEGTIERMKTQAAKGNKSIEKSTKGKFKKRLRKNVKRKIKPLIPSAILGKRE